MSNEKIGRYKGIVSFFDNQKGYGYVRLLKNNRDITSGSGVRILQKDINDSYQGLFEDVVVEFDLHRISYKNKKSFKALNLCKIRSGSDLVKGLGRRVEF